MCNSNLSVMQTNDDLLHQHEEDAMGIYKFRGVLKGTDTPIYYKPKNIAATWGPFFISYWNGGWKITVRNLENSCNTAKMLKTSLTKMYYYLFEGKKSGRRYWYDKNM